MGEKMIRRMCLKNFGRKRLIFCLSQILRQEKSNNALIKFMDSELVKLYIRELEDDQMWALFEIVISAIKKIRSTCFSYIECNQAELWEKKIIETRLEKKRKKIMRERLENIKVKRHKYKKCNVKRNELKMKYPKTSILRKMKN